MHNFPAFVPFCPRLFPKLTKKGTNAGKREQTRGSLPEFVYEMGRNGNKRGQKGTNAGKINNKNRGRRVGEDWSTAVLGDSRANRK